MWIEKYFPVFSMEDVELLNFLSSHLSNYYGRKNVKLTPDYLLANGKIPVLLTCHVDTVHDKKPTKIKMVNSYVYSPGGALGADDRAGVIGILKIVEDGYFPHLIFNTDEEIGGQGAALVCRDLKLPKDVKYVIELDREGDSEAVFYNDANKSFQEYVKSFGYIIEIGSFSDISVLCPHWGVSGVNLSTGAYRSHSKDDFLDTKSLEKTIEYVKKMLSNLPEKRFVYEMAAFPRGKKGKYLSLAEFMPPRCGTGKFQK